MKLCIDCGEHPAVACDECRRALALLDRPAGFGSIARHPDQGTECRLCDQGDPELCVDCLCRRVLDARADPNGPYAAPSPEEFQTAEASAPEEQARFGQMNQQLGTDALSSIYDRRPADRGPTWYRTIGAAL
jgi:hypothetical protein